MPYLSERDCWVFPVHLLGIAASGFPALKLTIFVRSIGSKTMKKAIWAIFSASALLIASPSLSSTKGTPPPRRRSRARQAMRSSATSA